MTEQQRRCEKERSPPLGYDLRWVECDDLPGPDPNLGEIERWSRDAEHGYLQLNIRGMARVREAMAEQGLLATNTPPEAPRPKDFGLTCPIQYSHETSDPRERAFWDTWHDYLAAQLAEPGIAAWKLCSNDGWLVTPEEIDSVLERLPEQNPYPDWPTWAIWIQFLRGAAVHGGFVVW